MVTFNSFKSFQYANKHLALSALPVRYHIPKQQCRQHWPPRPVVFFDNLGVGTGASGTSAGTAYYVMIDHHISMMATVSFAFTGYATSTLLAKQTF